MAIKAEQKGRKGDKMLAHLTPGEIVIPRSFAEDDDFRAIIAEFFRDNNVDLEVFIVGSGKNKINPETGYMEFGFWSKLNPFKRGSFFRQWFDPALKAVLALPKKMQETLFPTPKLPAPPPLPPPPAISETRTIEEAREFERRQAARRRRRHRTIITGELEPVTTKKTLLGGGSSSETAGTGKPIVKF